mmetsp:Transcript_8992/g.28696  ORF Transcript_8992/g.28696 Transcript_8992/m.28696 type:complete len:257 (+) Transcript_8992:637-1407(+)
METGRMGMKRYSHRSGCSSERAAWTTDERVASDRDAKTTRRSMSNEEKTSRMVVGSNSRSIGAKSTEARAAAASAGRVSTISCTVPGSRHDTTVTLIDRPGGGKGACVTASRKARMAECESSRCCTSRRMSSETDGSSRAETHTSVYSGAAAPRRRTSPAARQRNTTPYRAWSLDLVMRKRKKPVSLRRARPRSSSPTSSPASTSRTLSLDVVRSVAAARRSASPSSCPSSGQMNLLDPSAVSLFSTSAHNFTGVG